MNYIGRLCLPTQSGALPLNKILCSCQFYKITSLFNVTIHDIKILVGFPFHKLILSPVSIVHCWGSLLFTYFFFLQQYAQIKDNKIPKNSVMMVEEEKKMLQNV